MILSDCEGHFTLTVKNLSDSQSAQNLANLLTVKCTWPVISTLICKLKDIGQGHRQSRTV